VTPKRGDRVAPPPVDDEWDLRFADQAAAKGWEDLARHAPGNTRECFERLRSQPCPARYLPRQHQLRLALATVKVGGHWLPQWQYEVTAGGRVWYAVDDDKHVLWITHASPRHPRATDR
jgi:hypothetical protein